jgi:hypothetical protein
MSRLAHDGVGWLLLPHSRQGKETEVTEKTEERRTVEGEVVGNERDEHSATNGNGASRTVEGEVVGKEMAKEAAKELPARVKGFGDRGEIAAVRQRMLAMSPKANEAPQSVVFAAAQLAVALGLNPLNGELYIANMGSKKYPDWQALIGVKGWRKKAREQSNFMAHERDMTAEEVKAHRGDLYHLEDVGVEVTLYRMDVAAQAKFLGIPYQPVKATGFWRKVARMKDVYVNGQKTGEQEPIEDNVPETWSRRDVAAKRAEVNAIKKAYDLRFGVYVADDDPAAGVDATFAELGRLIAMKERDEAPMAEPNLRREADGDIIYAAD